jgi:hypothetical protein
MSFMYNYVTWLFGYGKIEQTTIDEPISAKSNDLINFKFKNKNIVNNDVKSNALINEIVNFKFKNKNIVEQHVDKVELTKFKKISDEILNFKFKNKNREIKLKNKSITKIKSNILCHEILNFRFNKNRKFINKNNKKCTNKLISYDDIITEIKQGKKLKPTIIELREKEIEHNILSDIRNFKFSK